MNYVKTRGETGLVHWIIGNFVQKKFVEKFFIPCLLVGFMLGLLPAAYAGLPPAGWYKTNLDGFAVGAGPSADGTKLFTFDDTLYAWNDQGLYRMEDPFTRKWIKLSPPPPPAGPGKAQDYLVAGDYLYAWNNDELWWTGTKRLGVSWHKVTSMGLRGGSPVPKVVFNNRIYGIRYNASGSFEIWRTPDIGSTTANWEQVVQDSFGDTANNHGVDLMIVFNDHLYAGVSTLISVIGNPSFYGTGVEMWESSSGNLGSWKQVNKDGFGTLASTCVSGTCNFPIHQLIGSAAVYKPVGSTREYLYVGTISHYGAEIFRYDGSGINGWKNVTPPWAGPCKVACGPGRNFDMVVFNGDLYLAEGFPTANLAKYDGAQWTSLVDGPDPFDQDNIMLYSMAVYKNRLYVSTKGLSSGTRGDQVWGYSFDTPVLDVKANGGDGPLKVSPTTPVSITISLDAGEWKNRQMDYWLAVGTPWGVYSLVWGTGWVPGLASLVQVPLFDIAPPFEIFNIPLPAGSYVVYFGVDKPDGVLNPAELWYDGVWISSSD